MLAACQTTRTAVTSNGCTVFGPITYSSGDHPATVRQVVVHNAKYDGLCK